MDDWPSAYRAIHDRIVSDPQFPALVRGYGGNPLSHVPSRRCKRVALRICERLGLNPAVYVGNVYGAAAAALTQHTLTPAA